ncbi:MAG: diaminopimelate epimerase [Brevinematales bacterium]|nr:diaminopimelate epimerase [Brevinematales bacterium]
MIRFTKAEALGNDYILIDLFNNDYYNLVDKVKELASSLCDRHFGIGGDGIIFIIPNKEYDCEMRIFNADGSEAEMCGNGIRQVAKYFYEYVNKKNKINVMTKAGLKTIEVIESKETLFRVNMGRPILEADKVPIDKSIVNKNKVINEEFDFGFDKFKINVISMGNPHCVIFKEDISNLDLSEIGPKIENHPLFPNRVNVEFVKIINNEEISMRVWERGSGETMACGTGACASAVATILNNYVNSRKLRVHLLGGYLDVELGEDGNVYMTGGANLVYNGTFIKFKLQ